MYKRDGAVFPAGAIGIALNLEEDEVGCVILGDVSQLKEGDEVQTTGPPALRCRVGQGAPPAAPSTRSANPADGKGPIAATEFYPVEKIAPGIIVRKSVSQPLLTGIMAIDSMIPIGRGQRELIIGDRGTGKTTIAIDTIINQAKINKVGLASGDQGFRPVYSIYVAVGQKSSNIVRTMSALEDRWRARIHHYRGRPRGRQSRQPIPRAVLRRRDGRVVHGKWPWTRSSSTTISPNTPSAYRQISLILKRPSGREALPGATSSISTAASSSAARVLDGKGSLTGLPIIETQAGDVSAYIPTNVISITDGQIFLETDLFNPGYPPRGVRRAVRLARRLRRADQGHQTGRRQTEG